MARTRTPKAQGSRSRKAERERAEPHAESPEPSHHPPSAADHAALEAAVRAGKIEVHLE